MSVIYTETSAAEALNDKQEDVRSYDGMVCKIVLDAPSYIPSQSINIKIELTLLEAKTITSIAIEIEGIVASNFRRINNILKCSGFNLIYYSKSILVGSEHAIDISFPTGTQVFNHQLKFPMYLPYSYKDNFCEIKYLVAVTISYNQSVNIYQKFKTINLLPFRNLQLEKYLSYESRVDIVHYNRKRDPKVELYRINVWIPVSGVTSGYYLPIFFTVFNTKSYLFDFVKVLLVQIQIYKSQKPFNYVKRVRFVRTSISKFIAIFDGTYSFNCSLDINKLALPTISSPRWDTFQNIYEIEIWFEALKLSTRKRFRVKLPNIPIVIGTIPICRWNIEELTDAMNLLRLRTQMYRRKLDFDFSKYLIIQLNSFNSLKE